MLAIQNKAFDERISSHQLFHKKDIFTNETFEKDTNNFRDASDACRKTVLVGTPYYDESVWGRIQKTGFCAQFHSEPAWCPLLDDEDVIIYAYTPTTSRQF